MSSSEDEAPQAAPTKRKGSWLRRSALTLAALALVALGAAGGQFLWPRQVVVQQVGADEQAASILTMPNVLGLSEDDARGAISDAGYSRAVVTTQRGAAGEAGSVLEQKPAAQAELDPGTAVELVISTPTRMPALVGHDQKSAQSKVEMLGGAAQFEAVVDASQPPGTVLSTEPQAGKPMPQIVRLRVATGGVARLLTDLSAVERAGCSRATGTLVNGQVFTSSLTCTPRDRTPAQVTYSLSRKAGYLRFTLGVPDRIDDPKATAKVTVLVDGKLAMSQQAKFGTSSRHVVSLAKALRLQIIVESVGRDSRPEVVFGDIALMGLASDLDQLG